MIALDGKWDVEVGLWFEASYIHKSKNVGILTNQTFLNLGVDYTFGLGNGLNIIAEHLVFSMDETAFEFSNNSNVSAAILSYPMGFFDNVSGILYYIWDSKDALFFINYEHQFKNLTGYIMAFYNPENGLSNFGQDYTNSFSGPGFRLMLVYNH
ncbi:MAG: hypothetical protein JXJ22_15480 [Bacteroidales bacterium]|nr:hypothetical protein [Bacteroidales bacterium]